MISHLSGTLLKRRADAVVVDIGGVGYQVYVSQITNARLPREGDPVALEIHTHVREDALMLFGFLEDEEHEAFDALITMNGVGPKAAMGVLSGIEARELARAVCSGDVARLCLVPGIGKKRAERMLVELKDRLLTLAKPAAGEGGSASAVLDDLRSALANLGFKGVEVESAVSSLRGRAIEGVGLEVLLPEALRVLRG